MISERLRKLVFDLPLVTWAVVPLSFLTGATISQLPHLTPASLAMLTGGLIAVLGPVLVLLASGWISYQQLLSASITDVKARRQLLVQQRQLMTDAVAQLSHGLLESRHATSRLVSELVQVEEAVRAHLAGELHDTVAQTMSIALMALADVEAPRHREGRESLKDAEDELRAVLARMRPPTLVGSSLASAVGELCMEIEHRYGTEVEVSWESVPFHMPPALATLAYRVIQESLMNAVEHADGVGVALLLTIEESPAGRSLRVVVSDEGPGFDPSKVVSVGGRHVGLKLARERAEIAGGSLVVTSQPGEGTRVQLTLPLAGEQPLEALDPYPAAVPA